MKKIVSLLMLVFLLLLLAACGGGSGTTSTDNNNDQETETDASEPADEENESASNITGEQQTLRVSIGVNDKHPQYEGALKFKEIVESKTDDFVVEVYHSGQVADDRSAIEMLQFGTLEITIPSTSPLVNFVKEYGVFDLPFTIPSGEVADQVLDGPFGDKMFDLLGDQQLVGLAWWENGFRNLTNSVRPVEKVEDLQGLKIRTMENEIHLDAWRELGANPTPMAFPELFAAMQQGTVDGQENPYPTIELSNFYEVQDYLSSTGHVYTPFIFLFSKSIWDELTADQQTIIREAALEAGQFNRQRNREANESSLEALKEHMTFSEISPEEHQRFQDTILPVIEKHADNIGKDIVDDFLEEIAKHQ
ncbi:TRAP transporter substrate-binding protein [Bacillus alkalicellulosilyticus]|uniref:TRAP transporter substrate-binding protein n=1 Tax=Alkalihalobacterium alkalicellulosilyticum TaxID=1912214 RepID=UPI0009974F13|nr:TRAP transporter substrate-binding protein [Bacillus alkalicellulosilyticus]